MCVVDPETNMETYELAQIASAQHRADVGCRLILAVRKVDHQQHARVPGTFDHLSRLRGVEGKRLFAQDSQTSGHRLEDLFVMA